MAITHPTKIRLRDDIYAPMIVHNARAIRVGLNHESVSIDVDQDMPARVLKPRELWIFRNIPGPSPDGLVSYDSHGAGTAGIIEVKCPYSLGHGKIESESDWHHHMKYLDSTSARQKTHESYHNIQAAWPVSMWSGANLSSGCQPMCKCTASTAQCGGQCLMSANSSSATSTTSSFHDVGL